MYSLLHQFTCELLFFFFFFNKNGHKRLWIYCRAQQQKPAASHRPEKQNPRQVQFAAGLPDERSGVDFGTRSQSLPTNPAFFPDVLAQELTGELGKKKMKRKTERGGHPQGWREILYACALKHKVCGQLLKDFSGESRLSTE